MLKEILSLDSARASQDTKIPRKIIKEKRYCFRVFLLAFN